ncbi:MAG: YfhO family protein [Candidatus Omnitrophica bacterium]|nr:YfhO family protein [Candidatus Omnitrophota bacterium]
MMKKILNFKVGWAAVLWGLPVMLWIFGMRHFINGDITFIVDTGSHYAFVKYFFHNVMHGTVPLWEPFAYLGRPFISSFTTGVLHPFTYLIIPMQWLSGSFYAAYVFYIIVYFLFGVFGVYCLAKSLFQKTNYAYLAAWLTLFSGIGISLFNQVYIMLLFVPGVWFFYCFHRFFASFKTCYFLGMCVSLMLILTTYVPFYFLTVFGVVLLLLGIIYPKLVLSLLRKMLRYVRDNKPVFCLGMTMIIVSTAPLLLYKNASLSGDIISPARHAEDCLNPQDIVKCMQGHPRLTFEEASQSGTFGERVSFRHLFVHLDKVLYASDDFFFLPAAAHLFLFISLYCPLDKKRWLLFLSTFIVFLISLGVFGPLHEPLYETVFYFKYFRNFLFFMAFLMPMVILLAVAQFQAVLEFKPENNREEKIWVIYLWVVHTVFIAIMLSLKQVIISTYATAVLSLLFCHLITGKKFHTRSFPGIVIILLAVSLQPMQVMGHLDANSVKYHCDWPEVSGDITFDFLRSSDSPENDCVNYHYRREYGELWYLMAAKDSPGIIRGMPGRINGWIYFLARKLPQKDLVKYARYKLMLFDGVEMIEPNDPLPENWANRFIFRDPRALVIRKDSEAAIPEVFRNKRTIQGPVALSKESERIKVLNYSVNALTLQLQTPEDKILVYNDSYHKYWHAYIDGVEVPVYRTNVAFKGVFLPKGNHRIRFQYLPPGGEWVTIALSIFIFCGMLISAGAFLIKKREKRIV